MFFSIITIDYLDSGHLNLKTFTSPGILWKEYDGDPGQLIHEPHVIKSYLDPPSTFSVTAGMKSWPRIHFHENPRVKLFTCCWGTKTSDHVATTSIAGHCLCILHLSVNCILTNRILKPPEQVYNRYFSTNGSSARRKVATKLVAVAHSSTSDFFLKIRWLSQKTSKKPFQKTLWGTKTTSE